MNCLINRIGIKGCDAPATLGSGEGVIPVIESLPILLINDLPGVSLENISNLVDDEHETYLELWRVVSFRSLKKFEIFVKAKLNECYKLTDKAVVECLVCEKKDLFDIALWYLHGVELMIERTSSDEINRFTTIDLEKAEKLKSEFFQEYETALNDAVNSINPSDSECVKSCLECNDTVKFVLQTP